MSHTGKTYSFSTFQELVDRVPSNRISACLEELGIVLQGAKASAELVYLTAKSLAEADGKQLPELPEHVVEVPQVFEWMDDGKGELQATLVDPRDGTESFSVSMRKAEVK